MAAATAEGERRRSGAGRRRRRPGTLVDARRGGWGLQFNGEEEIRRKIRWAIGHASHAEAGGRETFRPPSVEKHFPYYIPLWDYILRI
jgi:hypothetical protein